MKPGLQPAVQQVGNHVARDKVVLAYSGGLAGRRHGYANLTFACLIALVLIIILDIDAPRAGLVSVNQESLTRLQQSLPTAP